VTEVSREVKIFHLGFSELKCMYSKVKVNVVNTVRGNIDALRMFQLLNRACCKLQQGRRQSRQQLVLA